jgi:hypothetical protein
MYENMYLSVKNEKVSGILAHKKRIIRLIFTK